MPKTTLHLPVIQNWSCHNCGGCCREHLIEVTAAEKARIEQQNWTADNGVPTDRPHIVRHSGDSWRLNHQDDGACVFLDERGLCRIHARFGEAAKPLACRVYPYAVHPVSGSLTVSLRFSCPSVVQNLGQPVSEQASLSKLSEEIVSGKQTLVSPPPVHGNETLDWSDLLQIVSVIDRSLTPDPKDNVQFVVRLMRVLSWLELVEQSHFETVRGERLTDYLDVLTRAARKAQPDNDLPVLRPSRMGRIIFRLMVAQLLRHDTAETLRSGLLTRFRLLATGLKYTMGMGRVPPLPEPASVVTAFRDGRNADEGRVSFRSAESPFEGRTTEIDELFTRYFQVKVQGMHFCGVANFDMSLVDGFRSLALMYPAALWVARMKAAAAGRERVTLPDVQVALATLDHNFAYSPALGTRSALERIRILGRLQQVTRLVGWYSL